MNNLNGPLRIGIGGPVGAGKTSLTECICNELSMKLSMAVISNDIYTIEDAVESLCNAFDSGLLKGSLTDSIYSNVKTMQKLNVE